MSHTMTALSAALPLVSGWSVHTLWMRRRMDSARRDPLTGLWTREPFEDRARRDLARKCQRAVLVLDLNRFKQINDTLGHAAGDAVIRETGQRLGRWAEEHAGVAGRLGGDEFAAVIPGYGIDKLRVDLFTLTSRLGQPVPFDGFPIEVSSSIGAAYYRTGAGDLSTLLRRADEQMYRAKQRGGGWRIAHRLSAAEVGTVNGRRDGRRGTSGVAA